jgi:DNA-binding HxlR family transcriptional regulator
MSRCKHCAPVPEEVRRAAGLLERRWTVSILWASVEGASRFNEIKQAVGEIPRPPRVEYVLTDRGRRLRTVLDALAAYAAH